jgi:succinate dehydrogenase / fumarate reductase membrane anchor subunit
LRIAIEDYVRSPRARFWLLSIAGFLLVAFFMLGTITLITFQHVGDLGPATINSAIQCK